MRHTVLIFDLGGKFMHEFGGLGAGPGWFQYPTALALNKKGNLIVADLFNQRVQILDIRFEYSFPTSLAPQKDQSPVIPDEEEPVVPELEEQEEGIFLPEPIYL